MKIFTKSPILARFLLATSVGLLLVVSMSASVHALPQTSRLNNSVRTVTTFGATFNIGDPVGGYQCGGTGQEIKTAINIGCRHQGNPITDATFAIIRLLSAGAGLAIVTGLIIAGIQLTASQGDPQLRAKAISRITNVVIALLVFIFSYAILSFVIPIGFFS
jgi:hypothetical protein